MWLKIAELILLAALFVNLIVLLALHIREKRIEKELREQIGEDAFRRYMASLKQKRRKTEKD